MDFLEKTIICKIIQYEVMNVKKLKIENYSKINKINEALKNEIVHNNCSKFVM